MTQIITRNGLPIRYAVEGMTHLCTDDVGHKQLEELRAKYVGKVEDSPQVRKRLRAEIKEVLVILKHQGRLYRRDGEPML